MHEHIGDVRGQIDRTQGRNTKERGRDQGGVRSQGESQRGRAQGGRERAARKVRHAQETTFRTKGTRRRKETPARRGNERVSAEKVLARTVQTSFARNAQNSQKEIDLIFIYILFFFILLYKITLSILSIIKL